MKPSEIDLVLSSLLGNEINDWEREELADKLAGVPKEILREIMRSLPVIWPVSYALFLAFVDQAIKASSCLRPEQYQGWVKAILDVYEAGGLRQAQLFMEGVEETYLCQIRGLGGIRLEECETRLLHYARSILGRDLTLVAGTHPSFDTQTLVLPSEVVLFDSPGKGFLLYKLMVTYLLHHDLLATYRFPEGGLDLPGWAGELPQQFSQFFNHFEHQDLVKDLFVLAEGVRLLAVLQRDYPGLLRDVQDLIPVLVGSCPVQQVVDQNSFVAALERGLLDIVAGGAPTEPGGFARPGELVRHARQADGVCDSLRTTLAWYGQANFLPGPYDSEGLSLPFLGRLQFSEAQDQIHQRQEALKDTFAKALGAQIHEKLNKQDSPQEKTAAGVKGREEGLGSLLAMAADSDDLKESELRLGHEPLRLGSMEVELSEELLTLAREVLKEFGKIPGDFIAAAVGRAGDLFEASAEDLPTNDDGQAVQGATSYDEWDYRRGDFRKNWCKVLIKDIQPAKGTFVDSTLNKHKGLLTNLRRQFEMMNVQEKVVKRQRDGDEIDLDAVIDSFADTRAGLPPSERLFSRLQRNDRQIAALFLVDMSSSTEGWVSTALKEALILMSEALAVLGDRFAIYGFSGMRRTRSELFMVKAFDEKYGSAVKEKIAGISPKEYTRMAPAIRHATHILEKTEAKVRLLITLSDGKPEDYDGYKGVYAIEDTRHALIEAKNSGIHPFCITVDKEAHAYMDHMYGEVNYIFIDTIEKLPLRIPEIYRTLTT